MDNSVKKYFKYLEQIKENNHLRKLNDEDLPILKRNFILNDLSNALHYLRIVDLHDINEVNKSSDYLNQKLQKNLSNYFKELIKLTCEFYSYSNVVEHSRFLIDQFIITSLPANGNDELNQLLFVTNELFEVSMFGYLDEIIELFIMFDQKYEF